MVKVVLIEDIIIFLDIAITTKKLRAITFGCTVYDTLRGQCEQTVLTAIGRVNIVFDQLQPLEVSVNKADGSLPWALS
jgi:hypothetical protein